MATQAPSPHPGLGFAGFVTIVAALMAVNALGVDSMLPALPAMADTLGIAHANQRQWIISAYLLGFGAATLFYGPLADRYGRKPIVVLPLLGYAAASVAAIFAGDFTSIIVIRVLQGVGAAAARVVAASIIRDCYSGRTMAKVMSLAFIVFLIVPILAPSVGQLVLLVAPWQWIFLVLAGFAIILAAVCAWKLPETLHPEDRRPIAMRPILEAFRLVVTTRQSIGYTLATTLVFGALFGFITSVQQIFTDIFREPNLFPIAFAAISASMAVASFINSRIVERLGTRRVSHSALIGFTLVAGVHLAVAAAGMETILTFAGFQMLTMFCFALAGSNFGAMAMAPMGHIAGTASSVQSFISTVGGALAGAAIGQSFDGTTVPMTGGFFLLGFIALLIVAWTEHGRLFEPVLAESAAE